jgi:dihydrolipoamide dehydrogenase
MTNELTENERKLSCDLLVLGGGPGGYSAAFRGADLGLNTIIVERGATLGGVCLNVGCIPSKALLHVAAVSQAAAALSSKGVSFGKPALDLDGLRAWKDSVIDNLTGGLQALANGRKVLIIRGSGSFVDSRSLRVTGNDGATQIIHFTHAIIAAGSEAVDPYAIFDGQVAGAELVGKDPRIVDSTGALALPAIPMSMLVVGGGVIGLELATVYSALGAQVDVVEKGDRLLAGADRDLVEVWTESTSGRLRRVMLGTVASAIKAQPEGLELRFSGASHEPGVYDLILVAVGRTPNGKKLGANLAGINVDERGFIAVDKQMRTNIEHIFAVGDIVEGPMLAHKAAHQGHVAAEAAAGHAAYFDALVVPLVAYTDPVVAWVGVT